MICIHCKNDSKKKDRGTANKCATCNHAFAFDTGAFISDMGFQSAIDAVSAKGRIRWSEDHLYYEVARRKRPKLAPIGCLAVPAVLFAISILFGSWPPAIFALVITALIATGPLYRYFGRGLIALARGTFDEMWERWKEVHGVPPGLIVPPKPAPARKPKESDLGDYSFDRAVVCDRPETVDLLLANNFHFENNCAVLSIGGYPPGPFATVMAMLRRNPRLKVYALHDATPDGCRLAHQLTHDSHWFRGHGKVIDVGLRPLHAKPFRGLLKPGGTTVVAGMGIDEAEAAWLCDQRLELAAIRPEQVLKRLYRAVNRQEDAPDSDSGGDGGGGTSGGSSRDDTSFSADAGDGGGSADGFG